MRYGKGPGELIGLTLNEKSVKIWAYGLHICTEIIHDLDEMRSNDCSKDVQIHKEEITSRLRSDCCDRDKIRIKLEQCINRLEPTQHPVTLVNIATGYVDKSSAVNVEKAIEIGCRQMKKFVQEFPDSFHKTISKQVHMLKSEKKGVQIGDIQNFNTEAIYARIMCLLSIGQTTLETALKHELSPVPTSLFSGYWRYEICKGKISFESKLGSANISSHTLQ